MHLPRPDAMTPLGGGSAAVASAPELRGHRANQWLSRRVVSSRFLLPPPLLFISLSQQQQQQGLVTRLRRTARSFGTVGWPYSSTRICFLWLRSRGWFVVAASTCAPLVAFSSTFGKILLAASVVLFLHARCLCGWLKLLTARRRLRPTRWWCCCHLSLFRSRARPLQR